MSDKVTDTLISRNSFRFPIRQIHYIEVSPGFSGNGEVNVSNKYMRFMASATIPAREIIFFVEVNETRLGSFTLVAPRRNYMDSLLYSTGDAEYNVPVQFIDGHDSYISVEESQYHRVIKHTFSKDEVSDWYQSIPVKVELARNNE